MKLKIKVRRLNKNIALPKVTENGDWIDLRSSEKVILSAPQSATLKKHTVNGETVSHRDVSFDSKLIKLGVSMQLPRGFEAYVLPRSSTYKNFKVILGNMKGVIDGTYCGNRDEWRFNAIAFKDTEIQEGDRICQFRIQLSQNATVWQKLRWLFSSGVQIIEVDDLHNKNRGGIGSTGIK